MAAVAHLLGQALKFEHVAGFCIQSLRVSAIDILVRSIPSTAFVRSEFGKVSACSAL